MLDSTFGSEAGIYPSHRPEASAYPAIVYSYRDVPYHSDGAIPTTLSRAELTLDIFSNDDSQADELASDVRDVMDGGRGFMGSDDSVWALTYLDHEQERSYKQDDGSDTWVFIRSQHYVMRWMPVELVGPQTYTYTMDGGVNVGGSGTWNSAINETGSGGASVGGSSDYEEGITVQFSPAYSDAFSTGAVQIQAVEREIPITVNVQIRNSPTDPWQKFAVDLKNQTEQRKYLVL
jgi:hypothetical protein